MNGYLLIDKPSGISSFGVVAKVRKVISMSLEKKIKIGHTGTLDPSASGLMILVVGSYTKRAGEFSKADKSYEAELTLGEVSSTGDAEGEIVKKSTHSPSEEEVLTVLNKFMGSLSQTPPRFSAVKVGGQRAYKLARAGHSIKLEPRLVTIYEIADVKYSYPRLFFKVKVSSGTYIRSLAEDIGESLGTGAYLSSLRRTEVGAYSLDEAIGIEELNYQVLLKNLKT